MINKSRVTIIKELELLTLKGWNILTIKSKLTFFLRCSKQKFKFLFAKSLIVYISLFNENTI